MKQKRVWILAMIIGTVVSSGVSGVVSAVTPDGVAQSDPVVEYLTEQAKAEGVDSKAKIDNNNKIMQLAKLRQNLSLRKTWASLMPYGTRISVKASSSFVGSHLEKIASKSRRCLFRQEFTSMVDGVPMS